MSTLHNSHRARLAAFTLLSLVVAQLAAPAFAGVQVEVRGVGRGDPRQRARLSIVRALQEFRRPLAGVRRASAGAQPSARCAGACAPSATTSRRSCPKCGAKAAAANRTTASSITVTPGKPVIVDKVDVKVTGAGANDPVFTSITNDLPIQNGDRLSHANYETLKGGLLRAAATFGYLDARMTAQRDARRSAGAQRAKSTSNSKPANATDSARRPSRRTPSTSRWCAASCATRRTSRSTPPNCCARNSRSTTACISRRSRCCPRTATATTTSCPSASWPSRIAGTACSTASATAPTRRCAAPSPGKTGA